MFTQERSLSEVAEAAVLIVGAGPVGATLALELAHHGVRSVLIDRSVGASPHPKMDYVNGRSMELLRRLELVDEIRARGVAPDASASFLWTRDFAEPPVSIWEHPSVADVTHRLGGINDGSGALESYQRVQGSLLEDIIRRRAREHPLVDLREHCSFLTATQHAGGVTAQTVDVATGVHEQIHARYLVGSDGANSTVRESVGIGMQTTGPTSRNCDVYFRSSDPALHRHGRFFLAIVARGLTLVSRDGRDTWTGTFSLENGERSIDDTVAVVKERLGIDIAVDEVLNVAYWDGRLAVAESYRYGSVFLAGDSAHQFYPTGGHGANTGLGDAVDLGWKLAAVVNGWGGPGLLDSYEPERRPVALFNREMCLNLLEVWGRFSQLVVDGTSPDHLAGFLEQETYQVDNIGIHFGYRYTSSPVVWRDDGVAPKWHWDRITPTTWPGNRVPSVRLEDGSALFDLLGTELTLVDLSGEQTGAALAKEADRAGVPLNYLTVDDEHVRRIWERDLVLVRPDQHVAWRDDEPPDDWGAVLDRVLGCEGTYRLPLSNGGQSRQPSMRRSEGRT